METRRWKTHFTCAGAALLACLSPFSQNSQGQNSQGQNNDGAVVCRPFAAIPVALAPGQPASYFVSGELCATPDEMITGGTVQLLIHGSTFNHDYWDFGTVDGVEYSYARSVAAHGFPTFAIDLIGAGNSSHPPSTQITNEVTAFVAHQIVQGLRTGNVNGFPLGLLVPFAKVILMGHSLGSLTVWRSVLPTPTASS